MDISNFANILGGEDGASSIIQSFTPMIEPHICRSIKKTNAELKAKIADDSEVIQTNVVVKNKANELKFVIASYAGKKINSSNIDELIAIIKDLPEGKSMLLFDPSKPIQKDLGIDLIKNFKPVQ